MSRLRWRENFKWIILGFIVVGILVYFGLNFGKIYSDIFKKFPGAIISPLSEQKKEEKNEEMKVTLKDYLETQKQKEEKKEYIEKAEKGEGITHLARKVVNIYLQENPQNFQFTSEHKVYMEDYLVKKIGERWLVEGEILAFSTESIIEVIQKAQELTQDQLENLKQYSQLVSY